MRCKLCHGFCGTACLDAVYRDEEFHLHRGSVKLGDTEEQNGIRGDEECEDLKVGIAALLLQAVATSIDALSAGFAIKGDLIHAIVSVLIIAVVTFLICLGGIFIGKNSAPACNEKQRSSAASFSSSSVLKSSSRGF